MIGCFGANFIQYDDSAHVANERYDNAGSIGQYFVPKTGTTYIPLTLSSYRLDKWLHERWAQKAFGSWAPGVRMDTFLIHAGAALFLWFLLKRLRFSENRSFFIALLFACHPLVCETVCWVSERKNTLAAFFGFAALLTQSLAFRLPHETATRSVGMWRMPAVCILWALALIGKPNALGFLPVLFALEAAVLFPGVRARLFGAVTDDTRTNSFASYAGLAALVAIALACLKVNLYTHSDDIVPPPGGTVFTALLTDLEIFSRYLFNLALPFQLSAMYYVQPILGLSDARVWLYGAILGAVISGTIYCARNRWLCAFGWFWFFAALATNANVIAIMHWMQDRYIYLSAPGFWIAASECCAGLSDRFLSERHRRSYSLTLGYLLAVVCVVLTASRGYAWADMVKLSWDATQKQPKSFYAHYGLGCALNPDYSRTPRNTQDYELKRTAWRAEFVLALDCQDADRFNYKQWVATELGKDAFAQGDAAKAERLFKIGATKTPLAPDFAEPHGVSLAYLCMLDLYYKRDPESALEKAKESMRLVTSDNGRFALANASIACSQSNVHAKNALLGDARQALAEIPRDSALRPDADELLKRMLDDPKKDVKKSEPAKVEPEK